MIILYTFILTELDCFICRIIYPFPYKKIKCKQQHRNKSETVMTVWGNSSILFFFIVRLITLLMLSRNQLFVIPWTVALQTLLFMGFFRQGY